MSEEELASSFNLASIRKLSILKVGILKIVALCPISGSELREVLLKQGSDQGYGAFWATLRSLEEDGLLAQTNRERGQDPLLFLSDEGVAILRESELFMDPVSWLIPPRFE